MKNSISSISTSPVVASKVTAAPTKAYREVAASEPKTKSSEVNISKVAAMKAAIENGTFRVNPEAILQGMVKKGDLLIVPK